MDNKTKEPKEFHILLVLFGIEIFEFLIKY